MHFWQREQQRLRLSSGRVLGCENKQERMKRGDDGVRKVGRGKVI